jgi:ABC-2 type transport system ATP-binding protein
VPTLITQGTSDTLFTLNESVENYKAAKANGIPLKMVWFCGGLTSPSVTHGVCQTPQGDDPSIVLHETVRWLDRYLKGDTSIDTGSGFEWISDTGALHRADAYPPAAGAPLVASGSGTLPLIPGSTSGALIVATPAANAVNVALPKVTAATQIVGTPTLTLDYTGTAALPDARVYAQIVDNRRGQVVGPVVTPIELSLDGMPHTLTLPIEAVALDATPDSSYSLQITDGSNVYFPQRQAGIVSFGKVQVSLPTVGAAAAATGGRANAGAVARRLKLSVTPARTVVGCHQFRFRVTTRSGGRTRPVSKATVTFGSHHVRTGSRGYARMKRCLRRPGRYSARVRKSGFRSAGAGVRAARAGSGPRFAG